MLLNGLGGNGNRRRASPLEMQTKPMTFKRNLALSSLLGLAGGLCAYILAWGLFTTHPEVGMEPASGRTIALWVAPHIFFGSMIYFGISVRQR